MTSLRDDAAAALKQRLLPLADLGASTFLPGAGGCGADIGQLAVEDVVGAVREDHRPVAHPARGRRELVEGGPLGRRRRREADAKPLFLDPQVGDRDVHGLAAKRLGNHALEPRRLVVGVAFLRIGRELQRHRLAAAGRLHVGGERLPLRLLDAGLVGAE
jgi:hypothetical protein